MYICASFCAWSGSCINEEGGAKMQGFCTVGDPFFPPLSYLSLGLLHSVLWKCVLGACKRGTMLVDDVTGSTERGRRKDVNRGEREEWRTAGGVMRLWFGMASKWAQTRTTRKFVHLHLHLHLHRSRRGVQCPTTQTTATNLTARNLAWVWGWGWVC